MNKVLAAAMLGTWLALSACAAPVPPTPARPAGRDESPAVPAPATAGGAHDAVPAPATAGGPDEAASRQVLVMLQMPAPHFHAGGAYDGSYPADSSRVARQRAARELARAHHLRVVDDWPMPAIGIDCFVMERPAGMPPEALLAALARDPRVAWAQPVNLFHGMDGDPLYPVQPVAKDWHLDQLHRVSTGRGVRIAVVDSGVDAVHPDLAGQVAVLENFVDDAPAPPEPHGTAVAGIMAARAGNGIGIAGVAPGARLMALRACWQAPGQGARCSSFTLGKALNFAITHGARVINLSLAGPDDRLLQALLDAAAARGTAVVGAIDMARPGGGFPASDLNVLAVGAQPPAAGARTGAFAAPGTDIPTCLPGGGWGFVSGTSYAAAHVSGLVALLAQLQPHASPAQLKRDIVTVGDRPTLEQTANRASPDLAAATIDACATIARAAGACTCACPVAAAPHASLSH